MATCDLLLHGTWTESEWMVCELPGTKTVDYISGKSLTGNVVGGLVVYWDFKVLKLGKVNVYYWYVTIRYFMIP